MSSILCTFIDYAPLLEHRALQSEHAGDTARLRIRLPTRAGARPAGGGKAGFPQPVRLRSIGGPIGEAACKPLPRRGRPLVRPAARRDRRSAAAAPRGAQQSDRLGRSRSRRTRHGGGGGVQGGAPGPACRSRELVRGIERPPSPTRAVPRVQRPADAPCRPSTQAPRGPLPAGTSRGGGRP